jgi:hypothetical protein
VAAGAFLFVLDTLGSSVVLYRYTDKHRRQEKDMNNDVLIGISHLWVLVGFALMVVAGRRIRRDPRVVMPLTVAGFGMFFTGLCAAVLVAGTPAPEPVLTDVPTVQYTYEPPADGWLDI